MRCFKSLLCGVLIAALLCGCGAQSSSVPQKSSDFTAVPSSSSAPPVANLDALKYRAIWISYLEWKLFDTTSEAAFTQSVSDMFDKCADAGLNCVIVQVRPFGDAMYKSALFPWSHLITGTQGKDPGFDPLAIMVNEAHARALAIEAWVNPYRVRLNEKMPENLAKNNPALTHPEWALASEDGLYYNPALPEVQKLIVDGAMEIVNNYEVDGIQFDDYFYPTNDAAFDMDSYLKLANGQELSAWRRENVNTLVRTVYATIKAAKPAVQFGISPQGNNDQNYNAQYSDVALWLSTPGYVDYIMPQIYWGYGYTQQNGSNRFAFENVTKEWAALPRDASVSLAIGLGAYRIGVGDGGQNDQSEWASGHNLADMLDTLSKMPDIEGFAIYRYEHLFANAEFGDLSIAERKAVTEKLTIK
ncbi:MAG: family 10 glycosylhydrolase [Ruthenibacterium sp.]